MENIISNIKIPEDKSSAVMLTDRHGGIRYLNEFGQLHREGDLPAAIHFIKNKDGIKDIIAQEYYKKDVLHRDNGPALIWSSGSYQHYNNGLLHNENGPACHYVENGKTVDEYCLKGVRVPKFAHTLIAIKDSVIRKHKIN